MDSLSIGKIVLQGVEAKLLQNADLQFENRL